ncbi:MAG: response regulator [Chloroflexota bacterium]
MTIARILVVDDDPDFCEVVRLALTSSGYEVFTAENTRQAQREIELQWPDLIILDATTDEVDEGLKYGEELHHDPILRHIPIIMTSFVEIPQKDGIDPNDYHFVSRWLEKPIEPQKLVRIVGNVLEQKR